MQTRMSIENPAEVRMMLTITMTCREWEELREQLASKYPSTQLSYEITDAFSKIRKIVYPTVKE